MSSTVIDISRCTFRYGHHRPVLEDVSLEVDERDFLGIVGPNGGGKTTLLKIVLGLLAPERGGVRVCGEPPARGRRHVGYVPQTPRFHPFFPITVEQLVLMGRLSECTLFRRYSGRDYAAAHDALGAVDMMHKSNDAVGELSGGELQRALIARALAGSPRVLILDEPTANVDPNVETDIYTLLKNLNERMAIVLVSHDIGFVAESVSRLACLNRRLVMHPTEPLSPETVERLYGSSMAVIHHDTDLTSQ